MRLEHASAMLETWIYFGMLVECGVGLELSSSRSNSQSKVTMLGGFPHAHMDLEASKFSTSFHQADAFR